MVPVSYILVAVVLAGVVAAGLFATHMYAIFSFYWAFGAIAFVLGALGVIRVASGVQAPVWVALALVSPFVVWLLERLRDMFASHAVFTSTSIYLSMGAVLSLSAAAMGCVRLIEIVSGPSGMTRAAYVVLAFSMAIPLLGVVHYTMGATWMRSPAYQQAMQWLRWPIIAAKYGALIAAPVVLVLKRKLEWWTLVPIVGIGLAEVYAAAFPSHFFRGGLSPSFLGLIFWLKPVGFFIGAAAIWRMGALLSAQRPFEVRP